MLKAQPKTLSKANSLLTELIRLQTTAFPPSFLPHHWLTFLWREWWEWAWVKKQKYVVLNGEETSTRSGFNENSEWGLNYTRHHNSEERNGASTAKNFLTNEQLDRVSKMQRVKTTSAWDWHPDSLLVRHLLRVNPSQKALKTHTLSYPWCHLRLHLVSSPWETDGSHLQRLPAISLYQKPLFRHVCASPGPKNEQSLADVLNLRLITLWWTGTINNIFLLLWKHWYLLLDDLVLIVILQAMWC